MELNQINDTLCVITLTVNRPTLLRQAIESVKLNQSSCKIRHVIGSECAGMLSKHPLLCEFAPWITWVQLPGKSGEGYASSRLAKLRTLMLDYVEEPWVTFLDDDNKVDLDHYAGLIDHAKKRNLCAVHSWRRLVESDGQAFDGMRYPWHPSPERAKELWDWCISNKVMLQGSDVIRDCLITDPSPDNVATIDMNEWVFRTETLRQVGFDTEFTQEEQENQVGEDDKLLKRLVQAGINIGCTEKASVLYRLGGVSNQ